MFIYYRNRYYLLLPPPPPAAASAKTPASASASAITPPLPLVPPKPRDLEDDERLLDAGLAVVEPDAPFEGRVDAEATAGSTIRGGALKLKAPGGRTVRSPSVAVTIIAIGIIMLHPVRCVSGVIVMINLISVIYNNCITSAIMASIIATMVTPIIVTINTHGYAGSHSKIRWIVSVIIRRVIRYIGR